MSAASRLPRPKLISRNVTDVGHSCGDAMIAVIQDSTASSGEEQPLNTSPECRSAASSGFQPYQVLPIDQTKSSTSMMSKIKKTETTNTSSSVDSGSELSVSGSGSSSGEGIVIGGGGGGGGNSSADSGVTMPMKRELAQTILKETVTTGAGYRYITIFLKAGKEYYNILFLGYTSRVSIKRRLLQLLMNLLRINREHQVQPPMQPVGYHHFAVEDLNHRQDQEFLHEQSHRSF